MSTLFKNLANKKWFVPIIIFLLLIIALSSLTNKKNDNNEIYTIEEQLEQICMAISGAERATVMITYDAIEASTIWRDGSGNQKITGVAVICEGGNDPNIKLKIHEVIKALFGLPSTRITVSGEKSQ